MVAQIFNPILTSVNENLLRNTGFVSGFKNWIDNYWDIRKGIIDETIKLNTVNSVKTENGKIFLIQEVPNYSIVDEVTMSFFVKASSYTNCVISFLGETQLVAQGFTEVNYFKIPNPLILNEFVKVSTTIKASAFSEPANWREHFGVCVENTVETWVSQIKLEYGSTVTEYKPALEDRIKWETKNSFEQAKIGDISKITSYKYKKSLTIVGTFEMSIPKGTLYADQIKEDTFILYDDDWLIVNNVKVVNNSYEIEGVDGKGLLAKRITIGAIDAATNTMNFDYCQGSTEYCLKRLIFNNLVNPLDSKRKVPLFTIAENQNRGRASDNYKTRLEPLNEVATKLCQYADIGYDVFVDIVSDKMVFDVVSIIDRTTNQNTINQIVFSVQRGNVTSMTREIGNSNYKNVFYANKTAGNTATDVTVIKTTRGGPEPTGIQRNEMQLNVSCDSVSDIANNAKQEMTNYLQTDSFEVEVSNPSDYGVLYKIGDKVTIEEKDLNVVSHKVIRGFDKTISNGQKTIKLEFGEGKPKPLNKLDQKINQKGV